MRCWFGRHDWEDMKPGQSRRCSRCLKVQLAMLVDGGRFKVWRTVKGGE